MKTLPEILRDALLLLNDVRREHVVIARGHTHDPLDSRSVVYQMRVRREEGYPHYSGETRSWLGRSWSDWREHIGWLGGPSFDISDVLATDWRIVA